MVKVPVPPPTGDSWLDVITGADPGLARRMLLAAQETNDDYAPWDKVRFRPPPEGLTSEQWWWAIRHRRDTQLRGLPLHDIAGRPFRYSLPDSVLQALDELSRHASGAIALPELITSSSTRDRYLVNSLMDEAITSSQLEGAATTRRDAKEMLRQGRSPRTRGERMIANNYEAMNFVRDHADEDLTPALVCELHEIVTHGTLREGATAGRIQLPGEERVGVWTPEGIQLHTPPPADQLPQRLAALCNFANGHPHDTWIHPMLRAIVVHFMAGYDHYFEDGNGRTARALFYWVALKNGFWLMEFISISRILSGAPSKYARAYLHTEQDNEDLTYFALHQLEVVQRSVADLHHYLAHKAEDAIAARESASTLGLNHRQLAIVEGALRNASTRFTVRSHAQSHRTALATARTDLRGLERLGLLRETGAGRAQEWVATPQLLQLARTR